MPTQTIEQYKASIHTSLVAAVEGMGAYELDESGNPLLRKQDTLTIINSIFKE